jgi:hypothetical protein
MRWIAVFAMLLASPALSLSCSPPNLVADYKAAAASSENWSVVVGQMTFNEGKLPNVNVSDPDRIPEKTRIRAQFVGHSLDANGFTKPYQSNVTLQVNCLLSWCGGAQSGGRYLAFLKHEGNRRIVFAEPCKANLYRNPSNKDLSRIRNCFVGGPCR